MITVTISDKGQITLPAAIRRKLGLDPHHKVELVAGENEITLRPVKKLSELYGVFQKHALNVTEDWETVRTKTEGAITREVAGG